MTATRSQTIRETEANLHAAIARGYVKVPQHPHKTWTELKAERAKKRRQVYKVVIVAIWVFTAFYAAAWLVLR